MLDNGPLNDDPSWTCCGDADRPLVAKCRDTERLDAAFLEFKRSEREW